MNPKLVFKHACLAAGVDDALTQLLVLLAQLCILCKHFCKQTLPVTVRLKPPLS